MVGIGPQDTGVDVARAGVCSGPSSPEWRPGRGTREIAGRKEKAVGEPWGAVVLGLSALPPARPGMANPPH